MRKRTRVKIRTQIALDPAYDAFLRQAAMEHPAGTISAVLHDQIRALAAQQGIHLEKPLLFMRQHTDELAAS